MDVYNTTYSYPNGNRIQQYNSGVLTTRQVNAANELTLVTPGSGAPATNLYDSNGNLTTATTGSAITTQIWSPENRLSSKITPAGVTKEYVYSDDGLRKSIFDGTTTTKFIYDEQALLARNGYRRKPLQGRYTGYPGIWGGLASQRRGSSSSFYGFDSQGSARILVSSAGVITDSYSWKVFGEELQAGSGTVNPYGYTGLYLYYTDVDGNVVAGPIILVAADGRRASRNEIIVFGIGLDLYSYANNDPVSLIDQPSMSPRLLGPNAKAVDPFPLGHPATAAELSACLGSVNPCGTKHPEATPSVMMCIMYHENGFNPTGNPNTDPTGTYPNTHEGMGNLTEIGFHELCNQAWFRFVSGFCHKPYKEIGYYRFLATATNCQKAAAAYQFLTVVGLIKYGPPSGQGSYGDNLTLAGIPCAACGNCLPMPGAYFCLHSDDNPAHLIGDPFGILKPPPFTDEQAARSCLDLVRVHPYGSRGLSKKPPREARSPFCKLEQAIPICERSLHAKTIVR